MTTDAPFPNFDAEPAASQPPSDASPADGAAFADASQAAGPQAVSGSAGPRAVYEVPLNVQVMLGQSEMTVDKVMKLGRGAVVEIDRRVGDAVDVCVNNHLVARGEVVIVDGDKLGVALTEVIGAPAA